MESMHPLVQKIANFISIHGLEDASFLMTVSGGRDSVVLLHVLYHLGVDVSVAHCNFQLREEASDDDEKFVRKICQINQINFHWKKFDTESIAKTNNTSIQLTARSLRYEWFNNLLKEHSYDCIVTAHHLNDNLETVLYNLVKGGGIQLLEGIPAINGTIIRPLLSATQEEINDYALTHKIKWRNDLSNESLKYARNRIRHTIIPDLKKINPGVESTFFHNQKIWKLSLDFYKDAILKELSDRLTKQDQFTYFRLSSSFPHEHLLITEWLRPEGFTLSQLEDIYTAVENQATGAIFTTSELHLTYDRDRLALRALNHQERSEIITIDHLEENISIQGFTLEIINPDDIQFSSDKSIAYFDLEKIEFPLQYRQWRTGERMSPFGMKGNKLVSDILTDAKYPSHLKENYKLWVDKNDTIIWMPNVKNSAVATIDNETIRAIVMNYNS